MYGENEQILQVAILRELGIGASVEHDLLEQADQLVRHVGLHKGAHSVGDLLGVLGLGQRRRDDLVDQLLTILVLRIEHARPQLGVLSLNEITRLQLC
jgi:hypothetical protein